MDDITTFTLSLTPRTHSICLCMIVKNESKIIRRMLDTVFDVVDNFCICDTGSTDNTIEIIKQFFANKQTTKCVNIIQHPFENFSQSRNYALSECLQMETISDYILLLDADMVLTNGYTEFKLSDSDDDFLSKHRCSKHDIERILKNECDFYSFYQGTNSYYYKNIRLIKSTSAKEHNFVYVGATHEYLNIPEIDDVKLNGETVDKANIFIYDFDDGGCKQDKFERDVKILNKEVFEDPSNTRALFYLGNSYYGLGKYAMAISSFSSRIKKGGWEQEIWYSHYMIGKCCLKIKSAFTSAIHFLECIQLEPRRLEAYYQLIKLYRDANKYELCSLFYNAGIKMLTSLEVPNPENKTRRKLSSEIDDFLFLEKYIYDYGLYEEYTIFSAYLGNTNINNELMIIMNRCENETVINTLLGNLKYYKQILTPNNKIVIDNKIAIKLKRGANGENTEVDTEQRLIEEEINADVDSSYSDTFELYSSSSCMLPEKTGGIYLLNIRYVNYIIERNGNYQINGKQQNLISLNKYVRVSPKFEVLEETFMDLEIDGRKYMGIEDIRIYYDTGNQLNFIGTGLHKDNSIGVVAGKYDYSNKSLHSLEYKQHFRETDCEKNWVYTKYLGKTRLIYNWYPLTICEETDASLDGTKEVRILEQREMPLFYKYVRGSSCGYESNNEIWFVSHIVSLETPREYYHIISVFDTQLNLLRYTAPFKFEGEAIEFCLSIVVNKDTNKVMLNYSTWDKTTRIGIYELSHIESLLCYGNL